MSLPQHQLYILVITGSNTVEDVAMGAAKVVEKVVAVDHVAGVAF